MASRRYQPRFREAEKQALLQAIGACRKSCIEAGHHALFDRKDVLAACSSIQAGIDKLAEMLTGDREYFWMKAHSSSTYGAVKNNKDT